MQPWLKLTLDPLVLEEVRENVQLEMAQPRPTEPELVSDLEKLHQQPHRIYRDRTYRRESYPGLEAVMTQVGLRIVNMRVFDLAANQTRPQDHIHRDGTRTGRNPEEFMQSALNIPLDNPDTFMHWYDHSVPGLYIHSRERQRIRVIAPWHGQDLHCEDWQSIQYRSQIQQITQAWQPCAQCQIDQAMLVNIAEWHSVSNPTDRPRRVVSFDFVRSEPYAVTHARLVQAGLAYSTGPKR